MKGARRYNRDKEIPDENRRCCFPRGIKNNGGRERGNDLKSIAARRTRKWGGALGSNEDRESGKDTKPGLLFEASPPRLLLPFQTERQPPFFQQRKSLQDRVPACCGYKRGVDYKIMKIYGSPRARSFARRLRIERKGYAICRAFRELCCRASDENGGATVTITRSLVASVFTLAAPLSSRFLSRAPPTPSLQSSQPFYRRNLIDAPFSLPRIDVSSKTAPPFPGRRTSLIVGRVMDA